MRQRSGINVILAFILVLVTSVCSLAGCNFLDTSFLSSPSSPEQVPTVPRDVRTLILNGQEKTIPANQLFEENGQLMLVARPAMEDLGVETYWDPLYKELLAVYKEHHVSFYANSNYYTYDTIENVMEFPTKMVDGELAVPVETCFRALGADIEWSKDSQTLAIYMPFELDTRPVQDMARSGVTVNTQVVESEAIKSLLQAQCQAGSLPAMGGAIIFDDGRIFLATSGVRKSDDPTPVANSDLWHMGSCTKAMTATMIAYLIERGDLRWNLTMTEAFPQFRPSMDAEHAAIDIDMLLTHTAGFPRDPDLAQLTRDYTPGLDVVSARLLSVQQAASITFEYPPGQGYVYSNLDYVVAASMAEQAEMVKWEDLMMELVFKPLGISAATFAGTGTLYQVDQPWPHDMDRMPMRCNGPFGDPYAMFIAPCGYAHLSLESWGKFIIDQMRGLRGEPALLQPASYQHLVTPSAANPQYAHGWELLPPGPDGSPAYGHSGSNGFNTCRVKMYPGSGYAVLVTTNAGDPWGVPAQNYPPVYDICEQTAQTLAAMAENGNF